jgi:transcriptional regulator with XRE-family HTH domain
MENWKAIIGSNVKRLRKAKGLTQEQLAVDSGIDLTYAGGIERGNRNPSLEVLVRIAAALDVRLGELFEA